MSGRKRKGSPLLETVDDKRRVKKALKSYPNLKLTQQSHTRIPLDESCLKRNELNSSQGPTQIKHEKLAEIEEIDVQVSSNLVALFDEDNAIPFIARYRKHLTNGMDAEKLRHVKETLDCLVKVEAKAEALLQTIAKEGPVDSDLSFKMKSAKTMEEIEYLSAPYKKESKGTLAFRARQDGLEDCAMALLNGTELIEPSSFVKPDRDVKKTILGIQHIIADIIAKDSDVLSVIETLKNGENIQLQCSEKKDAITNTDKYDSYKAFSKDVRNIRDYQVLAINRAEAQKILNVKLEFSDRFWEKVTAACRDKWFNKGKIYQKRREIFENAVNDAITRLLKPQVTRQIRNNLTRKAERSAISVFLENLKRLLMTPPIRGKVVLGIDPGVTNGCKVAVVSPVGRLLDTGIIYLTTSQQRGISEGKLHRWIKAHSCETIALGNGTFCRQTEEFLGQMIKNGKFRPLDVSYTIVDEQGVSIYSCSPIASAEFPDLDPNLISAVSLARRIQDPIAELVKVEPKHLGVGMYQHDVSEKKLTAALDEVVSECVSFVGVDLNTASTHLLRHIAGLTKPRADALVNYRQEHGPFRNRNQMLKVKGIGQKTFKQCSGFIRISPKTAATDEKMNSKTDKLNPLDQTEIHPEAYQLTQKLLTNFKLDVNEVGSEEFISKFKEHTCKINLINLASEFKVPVAELLQIFEALQKPVDYDLRGISGQPLFRRGFTTPESLQPGQILTGVVRNVVHFGAFVDIGVGINGLIHSSKLGPDRSNWVQLGTKVTVKVLFVDISNKKIQLCLIH